MRCGFFRLDWLIPVTALLLATAAPAQSRIYELRDANAAWRYGESVAGVGDINRDGHDDFIIGLPSCSGTTLVPGVVLVISGREGTVLRSLSGVQPGDCFGKSVAAAGDVDRDGYPDFLVGAPGFQGCMTQAGYARLCSGKTGAVLRQFSGSSPGESFGWSVAAAGDVNRDGIPDVAISAPRGGSRFEGRAEILSGKDGKRLHALTGSASGDYFGWCVAGVGDLNRDDHADFIVGSPGIASAQSLPRALVFCGKTGSTLAVFADDRSHAVGNSVCGVGDLDGDGTPDYAVGCPGATSAQNGFVAVRCGKNHSDLFTAHGPSASFGHVVCGAGDVDRDGTPDILVTEPGHRIVQPVGSVVIVSGKTSGTICCVTSAASGDQFGVSAAAVGDVDADGVPDFAAGALEVRIAGLGYVGVFSGCRKPLTTNRHTLSLQSGGTQCLQIKAGWMHAAKSYRVAGSMSGTRPGLEIDGHRIPLNPDAYFEFTVLHGNAAPLSRSDGQLDFGGSATASFILPKGLPSAAVGITLHHAFAVIGSRIELVSNAVPVTCVP